MKIKTTITGPAFVWLPQWPQGWSPLLLRGGGVLVLALDHFPRVHRLTERQAQLSLWTLELLFPPPADLPVRIRCA